MTSTEGNTTLEFRVLGRTLEHFGGQMYKRREAAIAELVANAWDALAELVEISVPASGNYDQKTSIIVIRDSGTGMTFEDVRDRYLILGRNRREEDDGFAGERRVMGRKGIGKLAGFGLAREMSVRTWRDGKGLEFQLRIADLRVDDNQSRALSIPWCAMAEIPAGSGTEVLLSDLRHKTPIELDSLVQSLSRRFTRSIRGKMSITINGSVLPDVTPVLDKRVPDNGFLEEDVGGHTVRYWYGFAADVIRQKELRGFAVYANGKTAQAPPYFFDVEATASGQHSTRYVIGEIEADFIDEGSDSDTDAISTDRQEIDWEDEQVVDLREWAERLSRKVLSDCRDFRGEKTERWVLEDPGLSARVARLDLPSQGQVKRFLKILGLTGAEDEQTKDLAGALVRAYEFRYFHDVLSDLETAATDPDRLRTFLQQLNEWKVLESRAVLEVIKGRLEIIDRLDRMILNNAPETAHRTGDDNLHDLIAGFPWLLNPEWQVLAEERRLTRQLREWGNRDIQDPDERRRYDFLALSNQSSLVVIEIKRQDHPVTFEDLSRAAGYADTLSRGSQYQQINTVVICGDTLQVAEQTKAEWEKAEHKEIRQWSQICAKSRLQYERHRAILEGRSGEPEFASAQREIAESRRVLEADSAFRGHEGRRYGLGPQDVDYRGQPDS